MTSVIDGCRHSFRASFAFGRSSLLPHRRQRVARGALSVALRPNHLVQAAALVPGEAGHRESEEDGVHERFANRPGAGRLA